MTGNESSHQNEHQAPLPGRRLRGERDAKDHFGAVQRNEDQADGSGGQSGGGKLQIQI